MAPPGGGESPEHPEGSHPHLQWCWSLRAANQEEALTWLATPSSCLCLSLPLLPLLSWLIFPTDYFSCQHSVGNTTSKRMHTHTHKHTHLFSRVLRVIRTHQNGFALSFSISIEYSCIYMCLYICCNIYRNISWLFHCISSQRLQCKQFLFLFYFTLNLLEENVLSVCVNVSVFFFFRVVHQ